MAYTNKQRSFYCIIAILLFADVLFSQNQNVLSQEEYSNNNNQYNFYFHKADNQLGKFEFEESL